MDTKELERFYRNIPIITRFIGTALFITSFGVSFKLLTPSYLYLNWQLVYSKLQIWRLWTDYILIGQFGISWLFQMYFLLSFSSTLERHPTFSTRERQGSYLYFLFTLMLILDVISLVCDIPAGRPILAPALASGIIYYWSKKEPNSPVSLWGFVVKAQQLPFAILILDVVTGQSLFHPLAGMAAGHILYFIKDVLPLKKNIHLMRDTPQIFKVLTTKLDFMGSSTTNYQSSRTQSSNDGFPVNSGRFSTLYSTYMQPNKSPAEFPGRGYRLGGN